MSQQIDQGDTNVQVAVRIRPLLPREEQSQAGTCVRRNGNTIEIRECGWEVQEDAELYPSYRFTFDRVFGEQAGQDDVYAGCAEEVVESFIEGFNSSIMAYGISSAGKTYTIRDGGVVLRAAEQIFGALAGVDTSRYQLTVSYYQIYNESVLDLLNPSGLSLRVRETARQEIYVEHLSHEPVASVAELEALMAKGDRNRVQAETKLNTNSSRSHAVLTFFLVNEVRNTKSKLQILDLAGSERISSPHKERQAETKHINQSLAVLGTVMQQIVQFQRLARASEAPGASGGPNGAQGAPHVHIGFRNSKLTRVLQDSIGGNCRLLLIVCVSPSALCFFETLNSLKFANRAKQIKQHATINEVAGVSVEVEIEKLKCQIEETLQLIAEARAGRAPGQPRSGSTPPGYGEVESGVESEVDGSVDEWGGAAGRLERQAALYEEALGARGFRALEEAYQRLQGLAQLRADSAAQAGDINLLRVQSLAYRDFLILLTDRLQRKEEALRRITDEVRDVRAANALLAPAAQAPSTAAAPVPAATPTARSNAQDAVQDAGASTKTVQATTNAYTAPPPPENCPADAAAFACAQGHQNAVMDYAEKCEEIMQLKEQFRNDIQILDKEYNSLRQLIANEKQRLEERTKEILADTTRQNGAEAFALATTSECNQERKLLADIFRNKLLTKVQQIQANGDTASIQAMKSYVLQLLDAVQNGDLHVKMSALFD